MDLNFLKSRIETIGNYQMTRIAMTKEREYYLNYITKLKGDLLWVVNGNNSKSQFRSALSYIDVFSYVEKNRINNGIICKPKRIIELVCDDVRDIIKSMERFE